MPSPPTYPVTALPFCPSQPQDMVNKQIRHPSPPGDGCRKRMTICYFCKLILFPDRKQTRKSEQNLCQARRSPQSIMDIYGQGAQRSMASVLSRSFLSSADFVRALHEAPAVHWQRAVRERPLRSIFLFPANNKSALTPPNGGE